MGLNYDFLKDWNLIPIDIEPIKKYFDSFDFYLGSPSFIQKFFDNYMYISVNTYEEKVETFSNNLKNYAKEMGIALNEKNTFLPNNDDKFHSSFFFARELELNYLKISVRIDSSILDGLEHIFIIDDYCGSAETIINQLNDLDSYLSGKKIFATFLYITEKADEVLKGYSMVNNSFSYISDFSIVKKNYFISKYNVISEDEIECYKKICDELLISDKYRFGWNKIEDLISFYYFTPNDTLGLFWMKTNEYVNPPFSRKDNFEHEIRNKYEQSLILSKYYTLVNVSNRKIRYFAVVSCLILINGRDKAKNIICFTDTILDSLICSCMKYKMLKKIGDQYTEGDDFYSYVNKDSFCVLKNFNMPFSLVDQIGYNLDKLK